MSDIEDDVQAFLRYYREVIRLRGVDQALHEAVEDCVRHRRKCADYLCKVQELEARLAEVEAQAAQMREALEAWQAYWDHFAACGCHWQHTCDERARLRGVADRLTETALASDAGRETAERLRLLEELAEAATAFADYCTLVECLPHSEDAICDQDPCLRQRLKAAVKALKGAKAG